LQNKLVKQFALQKALSRRSGFFVCFGVGLLGRSQQERAQQAAAAQKVREELTATQAIVRKTFTPDDAQKSPEK
jgi:hypothetical protein